jgi:imidazole glycerol-phosphate synthase subunit HisH
MGNLRSVQKAFERINIKATITNDPDSLINADKILLPGVGHFSSGMKNLNKSGFSSAIREAVIEKKIPILGICLGMQLLTEYSEEGYAEGLCLIKGVTRKFPEMKLKIPHMGWNSINPIQTSNLFEGIQIDDLVYFVHSYYVTCYNSSDVISQTEYGIKFDSAFEHEGIAGFQFHPEKSHKTGLQLLKNFNNM